MSEEINGQVGSKKSESASKSTENVSKVSVKKKQKRKNPFARWFREMRSELKKVVWPTPKQIVNNTLVALTVMVSAAIVIWAVDQIGGQIFQAIRLLGGS